MIEDTSKPVVLKKNDSYFNKFQICKCSKCKSVVKVFDNNWKYDNSVGKYIDCAVCNSHRTIKPPPPKHVILLYAIAILAFISLVAWVIYKTYMNPGPWLTCEIVIGTIVLISIFG